MFTVDWNLVDRLELRRGQFAGRTALVTGAARGIGEAAAHILAALGAEVVVLDILAEQGEAVAAAIRASGGAAKFVHCDLAETADVERAIPVAVAAFGKIDILVNNALHMTFTPVTAFDVAEWDKTFAINIRAPFLLTKGLLPAMIGGKRGTIVNVVAYEGTPLHSAYAATKSASRSFARSVSAEVPPGVPVHSFSFVPGIVDTPLVYKVILPQLSKVLGIPEEALLPGLSQNPGFPGMMPVAHCATSLVYALAHGEEYNGQVADPFDPLSRFGVIDLSRNAANRPPELNLAGAISQDVKHYLARVSELNRDLEKRIEVRTRELAEARARSETLLLNILPSPIAERLKAGEGMIADHYDEATVLFCDIANFTPLSSRLAPQRVVEMLNQIFSRFDSIVGRYELEKIKTIGDCYMVVGGVPNKTRDHAALVARAALEMVPALDEISRELDLPLQARIGVHSGPVVAGVIGQQKFIYDLWGDTVNTASRMESHGEKNRIHCSATVREKLGPAFRFESRGDVEIKGKGPMSTFFLLGEA